MIVVQIFLSVCALACALGFAYWYKRANTIETPPDDDLPFQGRMVALSFVYIIAVITACFFGGIGLVATIAVGTIAALVVWAVVSKMTRREAKGPAKTLPLWLALPLSGIWGLVPESWHCPRR
jgi:urea transporter